MLGTLEFILIGVIIVLVIVLLLETREYRRTKEFTGRLQDAISAYTTGYNALATTVQVIEKAFDQSVIEHTQIAQELTRQASIIEIHNSALLLNSNLVKKSDAGNPIP